LRDPSLGLARRTRIIRRVLAAEALPPLDLATLLVEERPAARAASFLEEQ
jgi:hypothetical protein